MRIRPRTPQDYAEGLAVEPPVCDLVDRFRVGVARVVSHTESEVAERYALASADEAENHSELAVRSGQIDLEAGRELRAVAAFRFAAAQSLISTPSRAN